MPSGPITSPVFILFSASSTSSLFIYGVKPLFGIPSPNTCSRVHFVYQLIIITFLTFPDVIMLPCNNSLFILRPVLSVTKLSLRNLKSLIPFSLTCRCVSPMQRNALCATTWHTAPQASRLTRTTVRSSIYVSYTTTCGRPSRGFVPTVHSGTKTSWRVFRSIHPA